MVFQAFATVAIAVVLTPMVFAARRADGNGAAWLMTAVGAAVLWMVWR